MDGCFMPSNPLPRNLGDATAQPGTTVHHHFTPAPAPAPLFLFSLSLES